MFASERMGPMTGCRDLYLGNFQSEATLWESVRAVFRFRSVKAETQALLTGSRHGLPLGASGWNVRVWRTVGWCIQTSDCLMRLGKVWLGWKAHIASVDLDGQNAPRADRQPLVTGVAIADYPRM